MYDRDPEVLMFAAIVGLVLLVLLAGCTPRGTWTPPPPPALPEPAVPGRVAPVVSAHVTPPPPPADGCPVPVPDPAWARAIRAQARTHFPDAPAEAACELAAIARIESDWRSDAVSPAGAMGLWQLMPATAEFVQVRDPTDPKQAARGASKFWRFQLHQWRAFERSRAQKRPLALASYNWGLGNVLAAQRREGFVYAAGLYPHLPLETRDYLYRFSTVFETGRFAPHPPEGWLP